MIVQEVDGESDFAVDEDVLHIFQVQSVVFVGLHTPKVVMVCDPAGFGAAAL